MTAVFQLTDGSTTLDLLEAGDHTTRYSGVRTPPPVEEIVFSGSRQRQGALPAFSHYANREITLSLIVGGDDTDDVLLNYSTAAKMLAETTRYHMSGGREGKLARLQEQPDGATYTVEYTVLSGSMDRGDWATVALVKDKQLDDVTMTLTCAPFAQETSDVVVIATALRANGDSMTITTPRGEVPVPLKVRIKNTVPIVEPAMIYVALMGGSQYRDPTNFLFELSGVVGAHTGYTVTDLSGTEPFPTSYATVAAVGATSGGQYGKWTAGINGFSGDPAVPTFRLQRWAVTANHRDHYGRFRVIGRMLAGGPTTARTLWCYYGTKNFPTNLTKATESGLAVSISTGWKLVDLGIINWPDVKTPPGVSVSTLTIELAAASSGNGDIIGVDRLILLPLDEACLYLGNCSDRTAGDYIVVDGQSDQPAIYVTDSAGNLKGSESISINPRNGPFPQMPPTTSRLFVVCEVPDSTLWSNTVDAEISYKPRYMQARGA